MSAIHIGSTESHEALRTHRKAELVQAYRLFAALRWGDLGDGHISARDPERRDCFWLLRYGVSFHAATVNDLILVGPDGHCIGSDEPINISAYYIHHPIHAARSDVVCVAHVHTPWGTPFSAECRPIEPITQESCVFFEDVALFDDEEVQVQSTDGGARIATALGSMHAAILRSHGLLTAAGSVPEAVGLFVILERVAEAHMKARDATPISPAAARFAKQDLVRDGAGRIAFEWLAKRHLAGSARA